MAAKPLRADAERSVRAILDAAQRVLSENPAASMEQIAEAAGVARTTVHRRFANREALLRAMGLWAWQRIKEAVEAARPMTAPPMVALHQATANVLAVKDSWTFALDNADFADPETEAVRAEVAALRDGAFAAARDIGIFAPDVDLAWLARVYIALISESVHGQEKAGDPDVLATRVLDTLLHGFGPRT